MLKLFEGATEAQERENDEENSVNTQVQRVMTTHAPTPTQPKLSTIKKASGPGTRRPQPEADKDTHKLHRNNARQTGKRKTHITLILTKHASHTAHAIPPRTAHENASFRPQPLRNETAAEEAAHKKLFFKKEEKVAKVFDVAQHYISLTKDKVSSFQKFWMRFSLSFLFKSGFRLMLCSPISSFPNTSLPPSLPPSLPLSLHTHVDGILNAELSKIERRESLEETRLIDLQWKSVEQAEQISTSHAITKLKQSQESRARPALGALAA